MNLDFENIDQLFEDSLEGMEITPSPNVKLMVQQNMFWSNAVRSLLFKAGLSVVALMSVTGAIWYANSTEADAEEILNEKDQQTEIVIEASLPVDNAKNKEIAFNKLSNNSNSKQEQKTTETNDFFKLSINAIEAKTNHSVEPERKSETETQIFNKRPTQNTKKNTNTESIVPSKELEQAEVENAIVLTSVNNEPITSQERLTNPTNIVSKRSNLKQEALEIEKQTKLKELLKVPLTKKVQGNTVAAKQEQKSLASNAGVDRTVKRTNDVQGTQAPMANVLSLNEESNKADELAFEDQSSSKINKISKMPALTVQEIKLTEIPSLDILDDAYRWFEDTVGINVKGEPIVLSSNRWSVGFYGQGHYTRSRFKSSLAEGKDLSVLNKEAIKPAFSYGFGAEVSYQFKQLSVGLGLQYERYEQLFSTTEKNLNIEQINSWNLFDVDHWQVDSTAYLNLDSLWAGDTVLVYVKDSVNFLTKDSTLINRTDSNWTESTFDLRNVYQYFEIPIFLDYTFNRSEKWQPFARVGLVTGVYVKSKASILSGDGKLVKLDDLPFAKFNFWGHLGLGIKYNMNKKWTAYAQAHYKFNINAILKDDSSLEQSIDPISLRLGIQYHF